MDVRKVSAVIHVPGGQAVELCQAELTRLEDVLDVLDEAAAWLHAKGVRQWPQHFRPEWVEQDVIDGHTWLAMAAGNVLGTVTVNWADPLWSDRSGTAGYVHRLAIRRSAAGLGRGILGWAGRTAGLKQCEYLRLDCAANNVRLRAYYASEGFVYCDDTTLIGPPGDRGQAGPRLTVSRYECRLTRVRE